jgi:hypothetical protein
MQILYNSLPEIVAGLLYAHLHALFGVVKLVDSHGSLSLLFVIRLMVKHFVNDAFDVWTRLIVVVPLKLILFRFQRNLIDLTEKNLVMMTGRKSEGVHVSKPHLASKLNSASNI